MRGLEGLDGFVVEDPAKRAVERLMFRREIKKESFALFRQMNLHLAAIGRVGFARHESCGFAPGNERCGAVRCSL